MGGTAFILSLVFGAGTTITVIVVWLQTRARTRGLDVLRIYAERGEEPPASVLKALASVSGVGALEAPVSAPTRGAHLAHAASNLVMAAGLAWLVWWRMPESGEPGALVIVIIAVIFFAARLVARLIRAYDTPPHER
jgi:hypothetical protein